MIDGWEDNAWVLVYLDDVEADFLAIYRIRRPWLMPAPRFFKLARRLFYYQGAMAYRAMAESEKQGQSPTKYDVRGQEVNHNTVAAKMAAKHAGIKEGEVTMVPFSVLAGQHGDLMEHTIVKAG